MSTIQIEDGMVHPIKRLALTVSITLNLWTEQEEYVNIMEL